MVTRGEKYIKDGKPKDAVNTEYYQEGTPKKPRKNAWKQLRQQERVEIERNTGVMDKYRNNASSNVVTRIPLELNDKINLICYQKGITRSDFFRSAVVNALRPYKTAEALLAIYTEIAQRIIDSGPKNKPSRKNWINYKCKMERHMVFKHLGYADIAQINSLVEREIIRICSPKV